MNKKIFAIIPLALIATASMALWISGWSITGTIVAETGTKPSATAYSFPINWHTGDPLEMTSPCDWTNPDGIGSVDISLTSNILSNDATCMVEPGKDVTYFLSSDNGAHYTQMTPGTPLTVSVTSGVNHFVAKVILDASHCPINPTSTFQFSFDDSSFQHS